MTHPASHPTHSQPSTVLSPTQPLDPRGIRPPFSLQRMVEQVVAIQTCLAQERAAKKKADAYWKRARQALGVEAAPPEKD